MTQVCKKHFQKSLAVQGFDDKKSLVIVDSPGWKDPKGSKSDDHHLNSVVQFLRESHGVTAFLILFQHHDR